jgi:hypothetical protein
MYKMYYKYSKKMWITKKFRPNVFFRLFVNGRIFIGMKDIIRKVLKEDLDWAKDVPTAFPSNNDISNGKITIDVDLWDYMKWNYDYSFVTIFFEDTDKVVEFSVEGETDVRNYENVGVIDNEGIQHMKDYAQHHAQDELLEKWDGNLWDLIRKVYPWKIKGIYQGYM